MSCKYDLFVNPPKKGSRREPEYHARPQDNGTINEKQLFTTYSHGVLQPEIQLSALRCLSDVLAERLAEGCNVHLDGIGNFQITLEIKEKHVTDPKKIRAGAIKVKGVGFKPDKELMTFLENNTVFMRAPKRRKINEEELFLYLPVIKEYFIKNKSSMAITSRELRMTMNCSSKQACAQLKKLEQWGYLKNVSMNVRSPQYLPEEKLFEE